MSVLVVGLVAVGLLWGMTLAVGWRVLRRARARSREINAQIAGIHRQFNDIDRHFAEIDRQFADVDRQFADIHRQLGRFQDLIDQQHRRLFRLEELATLDRAVATTQLARLRGSLSDEAKSKLLQHLLDVREALEVATERGER